MHGQQNIKNKTLNIFGKNDLLEQKKV